MPATVRDVAGTRPEPDPRPGAYYVTARERGTSRFALLLGPYIGDHAAALARVRDARRYCFDRFRDGPFASYGTCRLAMEDGARLPAGKLNGALAGPQEPCRGCGDPRPYHPDADYCDGCAHANAGLSALALRCGTDG